MSTYATYLIVIILAWGLGAYLGWPKREQKLKLPRSIVDLFGRSKISTWWLIVGAVIIGLVGWLVKEAFLFILGVFLTLGSIYVVVLDEDIDIP